MIKTETMDILLKIGMPAHIKGLTYICDAIELFETDPYYQDGKICCLYSTIADKHNTTQTSVERAIRHAFETTLSKGASDVLEQYLDTTNTQNSPLLRSLYFHVKQEHQKGCHNTTMCNLANCAFKEQFSHEALTMFCQELARAVVSHMKTI